MLQGIKEDMVDGLRLVITSILLPCLLLKVFALDPWVIQLRVCIGDFLRSNEGLETLTQTRDVAMALREGRHDLGMSDDERRVHTLRLDVLANELVNQTVRGAWLAAVDVVLCTQVTEPLTCLLGVQLIGRRELDLQLLLKLRDHLKSLPGCGEVNFVHTSVRVLLAIGVVRHLVATCDGLDKARHHALCDVHEVVHVGVRHIELTSGELWVVRLVDRLVAEDTAHLVHTV